ncbi:MAG: hypothetical protein ACI81P_002836 [Neolewinella sp.]|jgi:hypothetical protein
MHLILHQFRIPIKVLDYQFITKETEVLFLIQTTVPIQLKNYGSRLRFHLPIANELYLASTQSTGWRLYPNPMGDRLQVNVSRKNTSQSWRIIDGKGAEVTVGNFSKQGRRSSLPIGCLPAFTIYGWWMGPRVGLWCRRRAGEWEWRANQIVALPSTSPSGAAQRTSKSLYSHRDPRSPRLLANHVLH